MVAASLAVASHASFVLASHASVICSRTTRTSPSRPTSGVRFRPTEAGSMSTWMSFSLPVNSGGPPKVTLASSFVPRSITTSDCMSAIPACDIGPRQPSCVSGSSPRAALTDVTGIRVRSANARSASPAPDQNAPLPATTSGCSASPSICRARASPSGEAPGGSGSTTAPTSTSPASASWTLCGISSRTAPGRPPTIRRHPAAR